MILSLQDLKNQRLIWSAGQSKYDDAASNSEVLSSGYSQLDTRLGGWPSSGLVELQVPAWGIGELRLILPALGVLAHQDASKQKLQVWLSGPFPLMPNALDAAYAINTVMLEELDQKQQLWALETLLKSGVCAAVICWLSELNPPQAKRLQVAAKESGTLVFCLRQNVSVESSLPISLRLNLEPSESGLNIDVLKRQNAQPVAPFELVLADTYPQLYQQIDQPDVHAYQHNVVQFPFGDRS